MSHIYTPKRAYVHNKCVHTHTLARVTQRYRVCTATKQAFNVHRPMSHKPNTPIARVHTHTHIPARVPDSYYACCPLPQHTLPQFQTHIWPPTHTYTLTHTHVYTHIHTHTHTLTHTHVYTYIHTHRHTRTNGRSCSQNPNTSTFCVSLTAYITPQQVHHCMCTSQQAKGTERQKRGVLRHPPSFAVCAHQNGDDEAKPQSGDVVLTIHASNNIMQTGAHDCTHALR